MPSITFLRPAKSTYISLHKYSTTTDEGIFPLKTQKLSCWGTGPDVAGARWLRGARNPAAHIKIRRVLTILIEISILANVLMTLKAQTRHL